MSRAERQLEFLTKMLPLARNYTCAIDGGAYVGNWANVMADHFDVVHAFEPAAETFERLTAAMVGRSNVVLHNAALMEDEEPVRVVTNESANPMGWYCRKGGTVPAMTIDSLGLKQCGLIKLDLEGAEAQALRGASETLRKCKPLVIIENDGKSAGRYDGHAHSAHWALIGLGAHVIAGSKIDTAYRWRK